MGEDTEKLEKRNSAVRKFVEAHIGKAVMAALPVLITAMAVWIVDIQAEVAELTALVSNNKKQEAGDKAQWNALLTTGEKVKSLEVEVRVNQRLLYLITEKEIDPELLHLERLIREHDEKPRATEGDAPKKPARPKILLPTLKPRAERLREFQQQQVEQIQQQMPRNAKR